MSKVSASYIFSISGDKSSFQKHLQRSLSFILHIKQLLQPVKSKSYKSIYSVSAPTDSAPFCACFISFAVFQFLRGLAFTTIVFIFKTTLKIYLKSLNNIYHHHIKKNHLYVNLISL